MDPVEINAGAWYLRALRADDRVDDRPAVLESAVDPEIRRWRHRPDPTSAAVAAYVAERIAGWADETRATWAVCEPTTGEMLGEVALEHLDLPMGTAEVSCWALERARGRGMTRTAVGSVVRFGFGGLGLARIGYGWAEPNVASERIARSLGFVPEGRLRGAWLADDVRSDILVAGLLADDPQT
ncbi:RimJ/RimL family protein N-acetyltransferase [Pseudonocardia sediminis]|uniref:RimJ/RimL family protein N-acetyltransferase n=1 Tax=Pseudonocardia sediminis TaxID=1397368 RepID=A0A4V2FRE1_PSEST|nr:GNAT family N-acetyltransferase [Pseudonocardia sediminis]RZT88240.1 RimJ/RimL family protein N-acetyltransferase [Pseudonocardia sediminis]